MVDKRIRETLPTNFVSIFDAVSNELVSSMISNHETNNMLVFADKTTNKIVPWWVISRQ